jgi:hypothetical protein
VINQIAHDLPASAFGPEAEGLTPEVAAQPVSMKTNEDKTAAGERQSADDSCAAEILRIIRRRELVCAMFIASCVTVCVLMLLAIGFKWNW